MVFCSHQLVALFVQPVKCFVLIMKLGVVELSPFCPHGGMLVWSTTGLTPLIDSSRSFSTLIIIPLELLMFMLLMMLWNALCFGVGLLIHFQLLLGYCVGDFNMVEMAYDKDGILPFKWAVGEREVWFYMHNKLGFFDPNIGRRHSHSLWHTWCNYRAGSNKIFKCLDHAIISA